jgi:hypothetical protein
LLFPHVQCLKKPHTGNGFEFPCGEWSESLDLKFQPGFLLVLLLQTQKEYYVVII